MSHALRSHNRHTYQLTVSRDEVTIMAHLRSVGLVLPVLLIALVITGCSGEANDSGTSGAPTSRGAAATAAPAAASAPDSRPASDALFDSSSSGDALVEPGPSGQPGAVGLPGFPGSPGDVAGTVSNSLEVQVQAIAALDRIIVRTVDMTLVVQDVSRAIDEIAELATSSGGWVVASTRNGNHTAFISFRAPAEGLDTTLDEVRSLTVEVESESSTSQDVTDEYTDLQARIRSQTASEDALIATVREIPVLGVFAGESINVKAGEAIGFAGTFTRPVGVGELTYRWDFGDGSNPVEGVLEEGVTVAEAVHTYVNNRPIPYTTTLVISGVADVGEIEGRSSLTVRVREAEGWVIADWNVGSTFKNGIQALSAVGVYGVQGLIWAVALSPV